MSKDIRALRQVLYKLDAEKINRTPDGRPVQDHGNCPRGGCERC